MAFHSDAVNNSGKLENSGYVAGIKSFVAIVATVGFLAIVQPQLTVLIGAAAITSLSLTFVSLLQSEDNWVQSTPKLDAIYAVLFGMMAVAAYQLSAGAVMGTLGLLVALIAAELAVSALIASGVSSLPGMQSAPVGIALNVHSRFFGLLGRAA